MRLAKHMPAAWLSMTRATSLSGLTPAVWSCASHPKVTASFCIRRTSAKLLRWPRPRESFTRWRLATRPTAWLSLVRLRCCLLRPDPCLERELFDQPPRRLPCLLPSVLSTPLFPVAPNFTGFNRTGFAEKICSSASDIGYALSFDSSGAPLVGTGNKGLVYRIDSDQISTELLNTPPTQVTAFLKSKTGVVYAATGNVGNVYSIGPGTEAKGTLEKRDPGRR